MIGQRLDAGGVDGVAGLSPLYGVAPAEQLRGLGVDAADLPVGQHLLAGFRDRTAVRCPDERRYA
ncbi:hypothetical protein ACQPZG_04880 (plasmid) [Streptomyces sp. CA-294286]|uniref:hypothetical protein n=1 Tax=Streptomyces sp. CA-294286 TaxID=3240070 RepID=UPI003D8CF1FD